MMRKLVQHIYLILFGFLLVLFTCSCKSKIVTIEHKADSTKAVSLFDRNDFEESLELWMSPEYIAVNSDTLSFRIPPSSNHPDIKSEKNIQIPQSMKPIYIRKSRTARHEYRDSASVIRKSEETSEEKPPNCEVIPKIGSIKAFLLIALLVIGFSFFKRKL